MNQKTKSQTPASYARQLDLSLYKSRLYYSQNREDLILDAFFAGERAGFYVDVGAYDPDYDSVTKLFYEKGWNGINIEPQPDRFREFIKKRKRDINLNIGISDKSGQLTLRSYKNQGLSTFSKKISKRYEDKSSDETQEFHDIEVKVLSLAEVFAQNQIESIQFLKIDVEGLETEVIRGNDWNKCRPEVVCVEENHADKEWRDILTNASYSLIFDDGLNAYYTDNKTNRAIQFDYVKRIVIERGGGIKISDFETIVKLKKLAVEFETMLWSADYSLTAKTNQLEELTSSLNKYNSIKNVLTRLLYLVKKRLF